MPLSGPGGGRLLENHLLVETMQPRGNRPRPAGADRPVIEPRQRHNLHDGAGEEGFRGDRKGGPLYIGLDRLQARLRSELQYRLPRDTRQAA